jgi:uncharacterized alpha/beta hydrolase family protein
LAIEIRYIIETSVDGNYPKISKVLLEDGVETFRSDPDLLEVNTKDPDTVVQYYQTIRDFISSKLEVLSSGGLLTGDALYEIAIAANCLDDLYQKTPTLPIEEEPILPIEEE